MYRIGRWPEGLEIFLMICLHTRQLSIDAWRLNSLNYTKTTAQAVALHVLLFPKTCHEKTGNYLPACSCTPGPHYHENTTA